MSNNSHEGNTPGVATTPNDGNEQSTNSPTETGWEESRDALDDRLALATVLRCRELWPLILGADDSVIVSDLMSGPAEKAVLDLAADLFATEHQVPQDARVLFAEVERSLREINQWNSDAETQIRELLQWCFGPEPGVIQFERGRNLWASLISRTALAPQLRNTGINAATTPEGISMPMGRIVGLWGLIQGLRRGGTLEPLRFASSAEFAATDHTLEWHVPHFLVKGQPGVVGGPSKALKTSIMLDLAISVASPSPSSQFLERFPVEPASRVVLISAESGESTIKETAQRICRAKGVRLDQLRISWCFQAPKLSNDEDIAAIRRELDARPAELIIIDPLYLCLLSGNSEVSPANLYQVGPLLRRIATACLESGATPVLVHHFVKSGAMSHEPASLESLAFAGIGEFARQWMLINRREKFRPGTGHHKLWLNCGGSVGFSSIWAIDIDEGQINNDFAGRRWAVTVRTADDVQADQRDQTAQARVEQRRQADMAVAEQILSYLDSHPEGETPSRIRDAVGAGQDRAKRAIEDLLNSGQIEAARVSRQRRQFDGYRLADERSDDNTDNENDN